MVSDTDRQWTKEEVIGLTYRCRWAILNNDVKSKTLLDVSELVKRVENEHTASSKFSRWLNHPDDGSLWESLERPEIERIAHFLDSIKVEVPHAMLSYVRP